jgi:hypothetical protein
MCVILLAGNVRPTEEMVAKAWKANDDGGGVAWKEGLNRKGEPTPDTEVVFEKGIMNLDRMQELIATVPMPFAAHFRVASVGGVKPELTHPFIVSEDSPIQLSGRTKGALLMHNGHWGEWNTRLIDATINSNTHVPEGAEWSDSRALAWMSHLYGFNFMNLLQSQKGVIIWPEDFKVFSGPGWNKINNVWCSNDYFWFGRKVSAGYTGGSSKTCIRAQCNNYVTYGKEICWSCAQSDSTGSGKTITTPVTDSEAD